MNIMADRDRALLPILSIISILASKNFCCCWELAKLPMIRVNNFIVRCQQQSNCSGKMIFMENTSPPAQTTQSSNYFEFETDFVDTLQCIPMLVRMKLDNCGVKLKLVHWNQFTLAERQTSIDLPCATLEQRQAYRQWLQDLTVAKTGQPAKELAIDPNPAWLNEANIPPSVQDKAKEYDLSLSLEQWSNLTPAQRFALIKLSRPSHENKNFIPALQEFNLID